MRGGGMFLGMVVAGVLFYRWKPSPFILCGLLIMVFTYFTVRRFDEPEPESSPASAPRGCWGEVKTGIWSSTRRTTRHPTLHGGQPSCGSRPWPDCGPSSCCTSSTLWAPRPPVGALLLGLVGVTYMVAGTGQRLSGRQVRALADHAYRTVGLPGRLHLRVLHARTSSGPSCSCPSSAWAVPSC